MIFPSAFWTPNYFISSWSPYGLPAPPWGYEWVRYGDDVVLVDVRTGAILQVRYNVFW
jgi:Ni/Co efflux regulator RcnB